MSWTSVKADGRGGLEFRFAIEGLPYQFVTSTDMEQTTGGQEWIACLDREGLGWTESCQVPYSELETTGPAIRLVDRLDDDAVTQALAKKPAATTYLSVDATTTALTLNVLSTAGMLTGTYVHVGTEAILVGAVQDSTKITVTRAQWDTTAQAHYTGDGDSLSDAAVHVDRPRSIEGRRCYLYAYGDGDTLTGSGTEIFRGCLLQDAQTDGITWTLQVDSLVHLLNQDLGADNPYATVRGIYYSWLNPLIVTIGEASGATAVPTMATSINRLFYGFYVDNQDLCDTINDELNTATSAFANAYAAEPYEDVWRFAVTTPPASPKAFKAVAQSAVDNIVGDAFVQGIRTEAGALLNPGTSVSASSTYYAGPNYAAIPMPEGACSVPRGYWGAYLDLGSPLADFSQADTYPINRLYISGGTPMVDLAGQPAIVDWADDDSDGTVETIGSANTAARYITLAILGSDRHAYTKALQPRFTFPLGFGSFGTGLYGFMTGVISAAPTLANLGQVPFITSGDIATAAWQTVASAVESGRPFLSNRNYVRVADTTLGEYLAPEFRLRGLFPALDSVGKLTLKQIGVPVTGQATDHTIVDDDVLWQPGPGTWERVPEGTINTIETYLQYDPATEEWNEYPITAQDVSARSERKQPRTLEVKPFSYYAGAFNLGQVTEILAGIQSALLGLFAHDYATLTFDTHLGKWDVLCGDTVSMTISHVPNPATGRRGITNQPGIVIGRNPQLDNGRIQLTVLYSLQKIAGYAPTVGIATQVTNGAGSWILDVVKTAPGAFTALTLMESGDSLNDHFAAGMNVEIWEFATASPTKITGCAVESVDDTNSQITLTSVPAWTPSTKDWILKYDDAGSITAVTAQSVYAFFAGSDGKVGFSTGDVDAYEYTP